MPAVEQEIVDPLDKRKYKRLDTSFPVEFGIVRLQGNLPGISLQRGSTQNVSRGGICLETEFLNESTLKYLDENEIFLEVFISTPLKRSPIKAVMHVAWRRQIRKADRDIFLVGLKFNSIVKQDLDLLIGQAQWLRPLIKVASIVAVLSMLGLLTFLFLR